MNDRKILKFPHCEKQIALNWRMIWVAGKVLNFHSVQFLLKCFMCQKHSPNKWNFIIKNSTIMVTEFHQSFIFALIFQIREIAIIFVKTITSFTPTTSLVPVFIFLITTISIIKSIYETIEHWITVSISNSAVKRQKFCEIK